MTASGASGQGEGQRQGVDQDAPADAVTGGFLRDTVRNGAGSLLIFGARFIALAVMARVLGVETFGVVALAILCSDLLVLVALAGLPGVTVRFLPILDDAGRRAFRRLRWRWLLGSGAVVIAIAPVVGWAVLDLPAPLLVLFTCWVLVGALQVAFLAEMQGALRFDLAFLAMSLGAVALMVGAGLVVLAPSLGVAFAALMISPLVQLLPWLWARRRTDRALGAEALLERSEMIRYGANLCIISALTAIVWNRGELFVVEARLGETTLGHYGAAVTLTSMVWRLTGLLQGAVTPHLSRRLKSEQGVGPFLADMTRLTMAISGVAAMGLALMGGELVLLAFGPAYAPAGTILAVVAPGIAMAGMTTTTLGVQLMSNGRVPRNALIGGAVLLFGLAWVLAGALAAEGAALARALTMCVVAAAMPGWLIWQGSGPLGRQILVELAGTVALVALGAAIALFAGLGPGPRAVIWLVLAYAVLVRATGAWTPVAMVRGTLAMLRAL